jgi:hypothetical protein
MSAPTVDSARKPKSFAVLMFRALRAQLAPRKHDHLSAAMKLLSRLADF